MVITVDIEEIECWLWAEHLGAQSNFLLRDMATVLKEIMGADFLNPENAFTFRLEDATSTEWHEAIGYSNYFLKSENVHLFELGHTLLEWKSIHFQSFLDWTYYPETT